ncbi:tetratricopeptide repeat-containing sulfotransferase family protein [Thiorhodovibrio litoralis]|uniref:tetratricopeptide repeat-containing sulfotransferase family protein n=2 Tax=Thiorhodovibrio TaxID=61593 RepID=UPI002B25CD3D|nr:sulfotransferase [Thiorhodovibrio litoralis]
MTLMFADALAAATAHHRAGNLPAAAQLYQAILAAVPQHAEAWHQLSLIHLQQGTLDQADTSLRQALAIDPSNPAYWMHHGIVLKRRGQLDQALAAYDHALTLKPDYAEAHTNRGNVLSDLGRRDVALAAFDNALRLNPNALEAHRGRGAMLSALNRQRDALAAYDQALSLQPRDRLSLTNRILVLKRLGRLDDALSACDQALARFPEDAALHNTRGGLLKAQGQIDSACASYQRALACQPDSVEALINLAQEGRLPPEPAALATLQAALNQPHLDVVRRKDLHFALGHLHDRQQQPERAFAHYQAGHAARAEHLRHRYDVEQARARVQWLCQTFTAEFFTTRRDWGQPDARPIFILGMPRSGTTLTEQILASHPQIQPGGERPTLGRLAQRWSGQPRPPGHRHHPKALTSGEAQRLAARYRQALPATQPEQRATDKMPHNFEHLWLIALLFPQATVLHCQRDPMATCWSIYSHNFATGHAYADDLITLGAHYRDYQTLMAHWQQVLPIPIHSVRYEALVSDPEPQIRALLDHCGLAFHPDCLHPEHSTRAVKTASAAQVNQPIHTQAIERWRRYEGLLQGLVGVLACASTG